jgi:hypothetical protein
MYLFPVFRGFNKNNTYKDKMGNCLKINSKYFLVVLEIQSGTRNLVTLFQMTYKNIKVLRMTS